MYFFLLKFIETYFCPTLQHYSRQWSAQLINWEIWRLSTSTVPAYCMQQLYIPAYCCLGSHKFLIRTNKLDPNSSKVNRNLSINLHVLFESFQNSTDYTTFLKAVLSVFLTLCFQFPNPNNNVRWPKRTVSFTSLNWHQLFSCLWTIFQEAGTVSVKLYFSLSPGSLVRFCKQKINGQDTQFSAGTSNRHRAKKEDLSELCKQFS